VNQAGVAPGDIVDLQFDFTTYSNCSNCSIQFYVGLSGESLTGNDPLSNGATYPTYCFVDTGQSGSNQQTNNTGTIYFYAPTQEGIYYIALDATVNTGCTLNAAANENLPNYPPSNSQYIGAIVVSSLYQPSNRRGPATPLVLKPRPAPQVNPPAKKP
jgi:hypothetical protein